MTVDSEILKLVQVTLRTFYEHKFVILIDQLVRKEAMRDEELAAKVGLSTKDVAKIAYKLSEDGLLATHRRAELRPGALKASARTWYYIDYQRTIDVIKWRMFRIRKVIDDKLRNVVESQGYVCPRCKKQFSTLDAGNLLDFHTNQMRCDVCQSEVIDNENVEEVKRSKDQMNRLLGQTKPVVEGLKKTELVPLQSFNIAAWLEKHAPIAPIGDLPLSQASGPQKVTIELVEQDTEAARLKREAEAEGKRVQNALPAWIERSTITGELTSAGAAQVRPTDSPAGNQNASTSRGGGTQVQIENEAGPSSPSKRDFRAEDNDDVDEYYANLAAAQAAVTAAAQAAVASTSSHHLEDAQGSPSSGNGKLVDSGYEEFDQHSLSASASPLSVAHAFSPLPEVDTKSLSQSNSSSNGRNPLLRPPSAAASLPSSLGKRSREPSEDSDEVADEKKPRTRAASPVVALAKSSAQQKQPVSRTHTEDVAEEEEEYADDADPILTVAGKEMLFSSITEAMTNDMTPEEYQVYWDTMASMG